MDHGFTCANESDILALTQRHRFADLERFAVGMKVKHWGFPEPEVNGMLGVCRSANRLAGLEIIGGRDDRNVVDSPKSGEIVQRVMGAAESAITDARADADDNGGDVRIADVVLYLLQRTGREKTGGRNAERFLAGSGEASRDAH